MELNEAKELIRTDDIDFTGHQQWLDLGCGSGTFTLALASLLEGGSVINAYDKNTSVLGKIPDRFNDVKIQKETIDFVEDKVPLENLNGILMANSLHYVEDKVSFLDKAMLSLNAGASFLLIEYDTDIANPWVPYPLNISSAHLLFKKCGFRSVKELNQKKSVFGRANLYSMLAIHRIFRFKT